MTRMARLAGTCVPHGERTLTLPLRIDTSVASTSTPGLVTISRLPLRTSASISMCECGTVTWVKSSTTLPLPTRTSSCRGHLPVPLALQAGAGYFDACYGPLRPGHRDVRLDPGHAGQVGGQRGQLPVGPRGQGCLQPLVELVRGQPPVPGRHPQLLRDLVPVLVRRPQLPVHGGRLAALARRGDLARHRDNCALSEGPG